jgi:hypothetical protein
MPSYFDLTVVSVDAILRKLTDGQLADLAADVAAASDPCVYDASIRHADQVRSLWSEADDTAMHPEIREAVAVVAQRRAGKP